MSKQQEIQALINAKIVGQGSAIDAGSALPPILTWLNELAGSAVSPDSTDMTEAQQMAVRKNLGLYYETPEEDNTVQYDGNPDGKELYKDGALVRLSENIPSEADILAVDKNGEEITATFETIGDNDSFLIKDESISIFVIIAGEETGDYEGLPTGIYGYTARPEYALTYKVADAYVDKIPSKYLPEMPTPGTSDAVQYVPQELTEAQQMQARKNQDLYYSDVETQEVERTFYRDAAFEAQGTDDFVLVSKPSVFTYNFLYRFLNDTPQAEDIVQVYNDGWVAGTPTIVTESGYIVIDSGILVVYEDNKQITWEGQSVTLDKGIWAYIYDYLSGAGGDGYNGIKYNETTETVHKVPAKYLPDTPVIPQIYLGRTDDNIDFGAPMWDVSVSAGSATITGRTKLGITGIADGTEVTWTVTRISGKIVLGVSNDSSSQSGKSLDVSDVSQVNADEVAQFLIEAKWLNTEGGSGKYCRLSMLLTVFVTYTPNI